MSEHTPGPWKVEPEPGVPSHEHVDIIGATGWVVAEQVELSADARLIAAAPEMLAALEDLFALCTHGSTNDAFRNGVTAQDGRDEGDTIAGRMIDAARAAIAKATGGAS